MGGDASRDSRALLCNMTFLLVSQLLLVLRKNSTIKTSINMINVINHSNPTTSRSAFERKESAMDCTVSTVFLTRLFCILVTNELITHR